MPLKDKIDTIKQFYSIGYNLDFLLRIAEVSKSTYFYEHHEEKTGSMRGTSAPGYSKMFTGEIIADEIIKTLLYKLAEEYTFFGYKKLTFLLKSRFKIMINKKKVYRLCRDMGLLLPIERHCHTHSSEIVFNKVPVDTPDTHWQMDITYITIFPKIIFILDIIDTYTLELVGYKAGFSITGRDVAKTVLKAMTSRCIHNRLTIRTDNGPQFKSREFNDFCDKQNIHHERIPVRTPDRNPNIERFHRTLKDEFVNINDFSSYNSFFRGLEDYIAFYNLMRPHETLKYMTPTEFHEAFLRNTVNRGVLVV